MPKQNGNPKILAAGAAVQLLTGIPAAWGVFQKPVMAQYGFSRGQAMLSFAILVAGYGIGCAIGGFVPGSARPALCGPVGYRAAGRRQHGGSAGAAGQCGVVLFGVQHPGGGRQRLFGPGGAGLRPKVVCQPQRAGNGGQRCLLWGFPVLFLTVFVGFVENRWGMRVCFAALGVVVLAVCGASAAVLQNPPQPDGRPNAKAGKRPAAPPDGAHHAVPPVCCGGGAGSPAPCCCSARRF